MHKSASQVFFPNYFSCLARRNQQEKRRNATCPTSKGGSNVYHPTLHNINSRSPRINPKLYCDQSTSSIFAPNVRLHHNSANGSRWQQSCGYQTDAFPRAHNPGGTTPRGIILLMGMTGSGKSTFVSRLKTPGTEIDIGHNLSSSSSSSPYQSPQLIQHRLTCPPETTEISFHRAYTTTNTPLLLADTPGFDDTTRPDTSILRSIALPLFDEHRTGTPILGIIYLHDITNPRLSGRALKALKILQNFCGPENYPRIVFATTMWEDARYTLQGEKSAFKRHDQLNRDFWDAMFSGNGGVVTHLFDEAGSARKVVDHLVRGLDAMPRAARERPLRIMGEMAAGSGSLEGTFAYRCAQDEQGIVAQVAQKEEQVTRIEDGKGGSSTEHLAFTDEDSTGLRKTLKDILRRMFG